MRPVLLFAALSLGAAAVAHAQTAATSPLPPPIPEAQDIPFPGTLQISVDATDLDRRILRVHETIPVTGGVPATILFPKWLPGNHSPTGPIADMGGLMISADGQRIGWMRDPVDDYAFHLVPPAKAARIEIDFQYLSPVQSDEGRVVVTPEMLRAQWTALSFYPAGYYVRRIPAQAEIRLPEGWGFGTALEIAQQKGPLVSFKPVPYDVLIDSPLVAGRYFKRIDLDPGAPVPVMLDVAADRPDALIATQEQLDAHKALVQQAYKLYGARHYDHYDFLVTFSDHIGGIGLEHHRSSEDGVPSDYFADWSGSAPHRDLLPHEFTHSWNGKFRRPADLWTPDYDRPMQGSLLWLYEGQTQYWGYVLAARSGLLTKEQALEAIALTAATYDNTPGRSWKSLEDTTNDPVVSMRRPQPWRSWRRSEDYYSEGELVWLDVDTLIRQKTDGAKSLDDFARAFFGVKDGDYSELTYDFDAVVATLNGIVPYDWASFLHARLDGHGPSAPLDGISRGGYKLVYADQPTEFHRQVMAERKYEDFTFSLGVTISSKDMTFASVLWDGPAFRAGLTIGAKLLAVNGIAYDKDKLKQAIREAQGKDKPPIELLVQKDDHFRTIRLDYHGGLRYPRMVKDSDNPSLDQILAAKP
ncbi:MAG TPA: peptidase M61 [Magnetospirillaceae bacterium]|nr:peptidase M61 [Magnetospirillaceae bacterium]